MNQRKKSFSETIITHNVKSHYGKLFLELKSIIHLHAPQDIAKQGMEEYEPKTDSILVQLNRDLSQNQVHELVYHDFTYWFDPVEDKKENYKDLSVAIFNRLERINLCKQEFHDNK